MQLIKTFQLLIPPLIHSSFLVVCLYLLQVDVWALPEGVSSQGTVTSQDSAPSQDLASSQSVVKGDQPDVGLSVQEIILVGDLYYPEYGVEPNDSASVLASVLKEMQIALPENLMVKDLQDIAIKVSSYYRKKGLAFNTVSLKAQKVESGRVKLTVDNGRLGDVKFYNHSLYTHEQLRQPFQRLLNQTLYGPHIKTAVNRLRRYPGIKIFSYYSRGDQQGEVRLNVRIIEENRSLHYIGVDNYGLEETGEVRFSYLQTNNNPFSFRGKSHLIATVSETADSLLGVWQYRWPNEKRDGQVSFQIANSRYDIGGQFSELGLSGEIVSTAFMFYPWQLQEGRGHLASESSIMNRLRYMGVSFNASEVGSDLVGLESLANETQYVKLLASPRLPWSYTAEEWSFRSALDFTYGALSETDEQGVDDRFITAGMTTHFHRKIRASWLRASGWQDFIWHTKLQISGHVLPSAETFTMTGIYGVRGYAPGVFNPHSGFYSAVSIQGQPVLSKTFQSLDLKYQTSLFMDLSYGVDNLLSETLSGSLSESGFVGAGGMISTQLFQNLLIRGQLAAPLFDFGYSSLEENDDNEWQIYLSLKYQL